MNGRPRTAWTKLSQVLKTLLIALGMIVVGAVVAEIPPFPALFQAVDAHRTAWLIATGASAALGFLLLMGGTLALIMDRNEPLDHAGAEDVMRSVRVAPRPTTGRTASYKVWGAAGGRSGKDQFAIRAMKQAWRTGTWRRDPVWRRRSLTAAGAGLLAIGVFGIAFALGPPPIKVIVGAALLYGGTMLARAFSKA